jgi:hypothetical protein
LALLWQWGHAWDVLYATTRTTVWGAAVGAGRPPPPPPPHTLLLLADARLYPVLHALSVARLAAWPPAALSLSGCCPPPAQVAYLVYASLTCQGGPISKFLSWQFWVQLGL